MPSAFNRTIVELKHLRPGELLGEASSFNRTIVELKPKVELSIIDGSGTFNRTIVELKLCKDSVERVG